METTNRFDIGTVIDTQKRVITSPVAFYQSMPVTGGYTNPVIFVVVMSFFSAVVLGLWALIGFGPTAGLATGLASVILMPIFAVIGSFIGALILLVIWKLMGSVLDYEGAYRCLAFSMAIAPIVAIANLVPYLGQVLQIVWGLWLLVIASEHAHKISPRTATIVFGILGAIALISSLTAEYQARNLQQIAQDWQEKAEEMSTEDVGKTTADFISGLAKGSGAEMTEQDRAELEQATGALANFAKEMQKAGEDMENDGTAENAGAALGALLGSLGKASTEMARQRRSQGDVLALATQLNTLDVDNLDQLGTIDKPRSGLYFEVNDGDISAPLARSVAVYRDGAGIRYQLWLEEGYLSSFRSLATTPIARSSISETSNSASDAAVAINAVREGDDAAAQAVLRNAIIYSYDEDGNPVSGDECVESALQFPAASSSDRGQMLWLWCLGSDRQQL